MAKVIKEGDIILLGEDCSKESEYDRVIAVGATINDCTEYIRVYSLVYQDTKVISRQEILSNLSKGIWKRYTPQNL